MQKKRHATREMYILRNVQIESACDPNTRIDDTLETNGGLSERKNKLD